MSEDFVGVAIFIGVLIFIVGLVYYAWLQEKKRKEAWRKIAASTGFEYYEKAPEILSTYSKLKLFSKGRRHDVYNCLRGSKEEVEIVLADYSYVTGSGKNSTTHMQTLCLLSSPELSIPHCFVRKEVKLFDFLGKLFGGQDINFAEDKTFSDAFVLQGEDEGAVRNLFNQQVRNRFSSFKDENIQFEALGNTMIFHRGKYIQPNEVKKMLFDSFAIFDAIKARQNDQA